MPKPWSVTAETVTSPSVVSSTVSPERGLPNESATVMVASTVDVPSAWTAGSDSTSDTVLAGPGTRVSVALPLAAPAAAVMLWVPATVDAVTVAEYRPPPRFWTADSTASPSVDTVTVSDGRGLP